LELTSSVLDMDLRNVETQITRFIKDYFEKTSSEGVVLGLSGGIDSCTVAALSAKAIGGRRVLGLMLPERETYHEEDIKHAQAIIAKFKLKSQLCDITPILEAFYGAIPVFEISEKVSKGNIKARTRMIYIYYYANKLNLLVCGSSDKSETMMGYFTKWGDVAADIYPIMDLYKTQVRKLAKHTGVPEEIIMKPPSPSLWPGQTAERELGIKYETLDLVLYGLEHFMTVKEIAERIVLEEEFVNRIKLKWLSAEHKRRMLLTTKLAYRTVGADFRLRRG